MSIATLDLIIGPAPEAEFAAEALGQSQRTIANYFGERPVPRSILPACKGRDALKAA